MVDVTGFVTALVINVAIAIVAITLFLIWRPKYPWCFDTRRNPKRRLTGVEPPSQPEGRFAWLTKTLRYTDAEVMETAGLDALMFIKFFEFSTRLFWGLAVLGIAILLPVNYTSTSEVSDEFDKMSMANVPQGSRRFWAHLILAYFFCAWFYYLAYHTWKDYLNLRHQFLHRWCSLGGGHTILVHNLPREVRSDAALAAYFQKLYPGQVRSARMAKDLKVERDAHNQLETLGECVALRAQVEAELENNVVAWEHTLSDAKVPDAKKVRPQKALKCFCCSKVDAIDHNHSELERLNRLIAGKKAEFRGKAAMEHAPTLLSGFVTFHSVKAAYSAAHYVYDTVPYSFEVKAAPECRDVYWPNLRLTHTQRSYRTILFNVLTGLLILFWLIPMGFLQGLANLSGLAEKYTWAEGINSIPDVIRGFIEAYLPAILLAVFFILVPIILLEWSRAQGVEAHSWMQKSLLNKYFLFVVINFFFGAIVGGSIFNQISELLGDIGSVPRVLGQTIPSLANQFTTYVALTTFAGFPLQMAQVGRLIGGGVKKKWLAKTPREFEAAEAPPELAYGVDYPKHLFIFLIAIAYSWIAPIILPFSALYFTFGWVTYKYQLVHVYVQRYESGGVMWPAVYSKASSCLMVAQLCLVGILGLKELPAQAVLVLPLPVLTLLFDRYIHSAVKAKLKGLPLDQMVEVDAARKAARQAKEGQREQDRQGQQQGMESATGQQTAEQSQLEEPQAVTIHAEPVEEKMNNGTTHLNESYPNDRLAINGTDDSTQAHAAVGFPYGPHEQNRAYVEGDLEEYLQPELTPLVPERIEVSRAESYLSGAPAKDRHTGSVSMKHVARAEQVV